MSWWAALGAALIGVALRVWQYGATPSLWVDEAAMARNVIDRDASQLLQPLDYGQVAPSGFLLGVKLCTGLFGISEYALRLLPITAGVVSVALFFVVARRILRPVASTVAISMFSLAVPLIFFSSNLKPYSSDVAVTLLVIAIALRVVASQPTLLALGVLGALPVLLLFFSQAAVFTVAAAAAIVSVDAVTSQRGDICYRLAIVAVWALAIAAAIFHGLSSITPADNIYLHNFWAHGFMPHRHPFGWLWSELNDVFGATGVAGLDGTLRYPCPALFVVLAATGAVATTLADPRAAALLAGPPVLAVIAAALHLHPFGTRVGLFLMPLLLLLSVAGADAVGAMLPWRRVGNCACLLLVPLAVAGFWQRPPPYRLEHLRPVMRHVADHWQPGDALWVYYGAGQAFEYYRKLIPIDGDVLVGECTRTNPRTYLHQLDSWRGRSRVWILMSHDYGSERALIAKYLAAIGRRLDSFHAPDEQLSSPAEVLLYDLSDRKRLAAASAQRFPIAPGYRPAQWSCYGTMSAFVPSRRVLAALTRLDSR